MADPKTPPPPRAGLFQNPFARSAPDASHGSQAAPPSTESGIASGRFGRLSKLASVGLRSGAGLLLGAGTGESAAEHAAEVLGQLRGLAAKMGQMAGYVDGLVPPGQRAAYESALSRLQAAAPRSNPTAVRRFVEEELGAPIDQLFAAWDDDPVASASIGQVHRAVLPESLGGGEVAVKVQHPGIVRALENDLKNAGMLESMMGALGGRRLNSKEVLEAIRDRLREELDYALEARRMDEFRALSANDPFVHIPRVIPARSTGHVLSTEFVRGLRFEEAVARGPGDRLAWVETMWRFISRGNLVGAHFNADPHPGNYFFHEAGVVTFLDFGCVNPISPGQLALAHALHHAAIEADEPRFRDSVRRHFPTRPGRLEGPVIDYMRVAFAPLFHRPYRITRDYAAGLVDGMKDLGKIALTVSANELFQMPADMVFMNRLQFGFYSVIARLDVEVDYAAVERSLWPEVTGAHPGAPAL